MNSEYVHLHSKFALVSWYQWMADGMDAGVACSITQGTCATNWKTLYNSTKLHQKYSVNRFATEPKTTLFNMAFITFPASWPMFHQTYSIFHNLWSPPLPKGLTVTALGTHVPRHWSSKFCDQITRPPLSRRDSICSAITKGGGRKFPNIPISVQGG